jgi:N-acetylneuraminic acid mutarotase
MNKNRPFYKSLYVCCLFFILTLIIFACGGGSGGGSQPPPSSSYSVLINSPSDSGAYETDQPTITLEGSSFVPIGASCTGIIGTMPPGYDVTLSNSATSTSGGYAGFYLGCLLQVHVIWTAGPIPLAIGANAITVTATDAEGNIGRGTIVVTRGPDTTPPTVVLVSPFNGATGVAVNTRVAFNFSEAMDPSTINATTITLKDAGNNPVPVTVSYYGYSLSADMSPTTLLAFNTTYQVTVSTGVKDSVGGNELATPYTSSFTTGLNSDKTPPSIQSVSPASGTYCASTTSTLAAEFSEDIDPATVNTGAFILIGAGNQAVDGSVSYANRTATFVPTVALTAGALFTATLTTGIRDLAGNALGSPFTWNFTTLVSQGVGTWIPTSDTDSPYAREGHVAVWTGSEMIVAGGLAWNSDWNMFDYTDQYGRYNPITRMWTLATGAPGAFDQKAVWTGTRMLVWGGYISGSPVTGGAAFDPVTKAWTPIATAGQPAARYDHTAVWTGSEMIVWGGRKASYGLPFGDGARYNPVNNAWLSVSATGAPAARYGHTAVWTGSEMIVWGGVGNGVIFSDGARYNASTDIWTSLSTTGAPSARYGHVAVWTGSEMIVWSQEFGGTSPGDLYNPTTDSWRAMDTLCALSGRGHVPAIWTGTRMIVWGGRTVNSYFADGAEYDPFGNAWVKLSATNSPTARAYHTAVWTGNEMIIWGGTSGTVLNSGGHFIP